MSVNNRKHGVFSVKPTENFKVRSRKKNHDGITIEQALNVIFRQMELSGRRERTIQSYEYIFNDFATAVSIDYVNEINAEKIYEYLAHCDVQPATKLIRLKTIKAVLSRFRDNRWIEHNFWKNIHVIVDKHIKQGADENDIEVLLTLIDKTTFIGFRDAVAILTLYKTGVRIRTLGELRERHINFDDMTINLDGDIMKNHDMLILPIDDQLADAFRMLIEQNNKIRRNYNKRNDFIFITQNGIGVNQGASNSNAISKQLTKYAERYGLRNINAHALRRAFAKNLLNRGANIALISKALGHSSLGVTTQYLQFDAEEVAEGLRDYL
ncbi:tyrosine-type recombinase/integrase [Sporosarcina highlanderae]|uniref:Site-specific integrase n=1 Tax=Sporosarcina highlanderae TaxID=3035916 RepID=A0ABT8JU26_9BACL|nr:site-specific integrase [Sporosarcina highlanderae]MDN4608625.1 site-specific integrase [Sporosarcina highlanderae]